MCWARWRCSNSNHVPNPGVDTILGLRFLVVVFPDIALGISGVCLYFYPFSKEKVASIKEQMKELHEKKSAKVKVAES